MKLTNNLIVEQAFKTYPYNVILEEFTESWHRSTVNTFKRVYEKGWDLRHVLLEVEKFCKMYKRENHVTLLIFFHSVYIECLRHDFPDPSHAVPVNLSKMYASHKYSWQQMHQIRLGLVDKVDVTQYLDDSISAEQMKEIRLALQKSIRKRLTT